MKKLKKIFAVMLALAMLAVLTLPALADEGTSTTGTVTVNNAVDGTEYILYQILAPNENGYTVVPGWENFVTYEDGKVSYGTSDSKAEITSGNSENVKALLAYASENNITATAMATVADNMASFTEVPYGYYLVDFKNGVGGLFELNSENPAQEIAMKNDNEPGIEKKIVLADGTLADWSTVNVGDDVKFVVNVTLPFTKEWGTGTKYEWYYPCSITDTITDGLQMNNDVEVKLDGTKVVYAGEERKALSEAAGDVIRIEYTNAKNFAVKFGASNQDGSADGTLAFLKLHPGAKLTLTYSAKVIQKAAQDPNENNTVTLWYGDKHIDDTVYVYDFTIIINKVDGDTGNKEPLSGAEFVLKNAEGKFYWSDRKDDQSNHSGDKVKWLDAVLNEETGEFTLPEGITERKSMVRVTEKNNAAGKTHFEGFTAGIYYLYEIKAPDGYARREAPIKIEIRHKGLSSDGVTQEFEYCIDDSGNFQTITSGEGLWGYGWDQLILSTDIENHKGSNLPSTGGIGTTLFYVGGAVLVVGAGVVLFKKRNARG